MTKLAVTGISFSEVLSKLKEGSGRYELFFLSFFFCVCVTKQIIIKKTFSCEDELFPLRETNLLLLLYGEI